MNTEHTPLSTSRFGFYVSLLLAIMTIVAWGFAMIAVPPAGPYCPEGCMTYPYPDILSYYPRDYLWMYIAVAQLCVFLMFVIAHHFKAPPSRQLFSFIAVAFALISSIVLLIDYYVQFSVVPISATKQQLEGLALLTQYNGGGIFIALEELGFWTMSIAFAFLSPVFVGTRRVEKILRWLCIAPVVLTAVSFVVYSLIYGIDRDYRFEVVAISVNWFASIAIGFLCAVYFRKAAEQSSFLIVGQSPLG